jgi:two-component system LytT family sensor kinase
MTDRPLLLVSSRWLLVFSSLALATILGAIASGQHHMSMVYTGGDLTTFHALAMGMPYWYLWALLAPLVIWFARRVPLEGSRLGWRLAAHVGVAILIAFLHGTLEIGFRTLVVFRDPVSVMRFTQSSLTQTFFSRGTDLLAYGAILGIYYGFTLYRRLREREIAASRLAAQLAQARLEALRSQLKPHFFFNAMNTIAMLVRTQENTLAIRTLTGMSDLLRHVLQEDPPALVPLREELEFITQYLEIERIRFHDRLRPQICADELALEAMVPNLLLQPLVENAVRHGVSRRAGAGRVEVAAVAHDGRLLLTISDDGPGFSTDINRSAGEGVGLRNTQARLRELYGDDCRIEFRDGADGGAVVLLELPLRAPLPLPVPTPIPV